MVYIQKGLTLGYTAEACISSFLCVKILSILKKKKNYIQYIYSTLYFLISLFISMYRQCFYLLDN